MLETLDPDPVWDEEAHEATVETLSRLNEEPALTIHVWGGDWCGDCRSELPAFGATLEAAGLEDELAPHPVDRDKEGDLVEEYGIEYIPTIVVESDGEELARFVESEPVGAAQYLADEVAGRRPET
jgi:thioredoxin 1